jgi:GGDEF domain-containing protein
VGAITSPPTAIQLAVPDAPPTHPAPRARPIGELSLEELTNRAEELARRWVIELIRARPLQDIGGLALDELAREAPALCAQALRAVGSELELERLTGWGAPGGREGTALARRLAAICGAHDPAMLAEGAEALRGVLWEALSAQLVEPSGRLLGDVCDRVAHVCAGMLAAALQAPAGARAPDAHDTSDVTSRAAATSSSASARTWAPPAAIIDEHVARPEHAAGASPERTSAATESAAAPRPVEVPVEVPDTEIEIRDQRREEGPSAWIGSIGAQLERFERDGEPFAVLLVELADVERLRQEQPVDELARLSARMERALGEALGARSGSLTRERAGRCWVLVPGADRAQAERLARSLLDGVGARERASAGQLRIVIGTAVCPDDGRQASALAAHADLGLYAARTTGRLGRSAGERPA